VRTSNNTEVVMGDSPSQERWGWDAHREWIEENTDWNRGSRAPDIIPAGVTAEESFGSADLVETAQQQNAAEARREWADAGVEKLRAAIQDLASERCEAARKAVEASLNGEEAAHHVREWWITNFRVQALLELLPPGESARMPTPSEGEIATAKLNHVLFDGPEPPTAPDRTVREELAIPETWPGRAPEPEREAEKLFDGLTRRQNRVRRMCSTM
jgi:hypothetical protein